MMQGLANNGGPNTRFWVGLRTNPEAEEFVWENGQYFQYKSKYNKFWHNGYPWPHSADFSNDNCVMLFTDDQNVTKFDVFDCFFGHLDYRHGAAGGRTMPLCDNLDSSDYDVDEYTCTDIESYCAEGYSCDNQTKTCVACHGGDDGGCNGVCSKNYRPVLDGVPGNMCVPCYGGEQDVGCGPDEKCSLGRGYRGCSASSVLTGVCTDRQECSSPDENLGTNAECTRAKGDVKCICHDGFECTAAGCTGKLKCGEDTCDGAHGLCIDTAGSHVCSCKSGYELGDGNACVLASVEPDALVNITKFHNDFRASVIPAAATPLPALKWNRDLAQLAQNYAEQCVYGHSGVTDVAGFDRIGENLAASWGSYDFATLDLATVWPDLVTLWHDEVEVYNYSNNTDCVNNPCGHYTQIVWANTTDIGCGIATCTTLGSISFSDKSVFLVCNYGPAGNVDGNRPYEVNAD